MMEKIGMDKVKTIAQHAGIKPGRVKGVANAIQFTKGGNRSIEVITWDEFEKVLEVKKLAVYEHGGFMKIMRA